LPEKAHDGNIREMKGLTLTAIGLAGVILAVSARGQGLAPHSDSAATAQQLEALGKKIDEQNAKIDALSQQILKLEQQLANARPGVMIGEATPPPAPAPAVDASAHAESGNTHTVAKGETLTSIAKMHGVTISELQKANHIENDRKLQIGQTLIIPGPASPTASPNN
jgi:LysM repeat protein